MRTISQNELCDGIGEILRRVDAGERFTVTLSGRPAAELRPVRRRQWISTSTLGDL